MDSQLLWTLISIQVFMGAFDTLVHHEGTERLAWRPLQKTELRLHGVRNFFYALIFLVLGWLEPHGGFAIGLAAILAMEVGITLWDFVEEDLTRKLPWTERINHTLLALNYGAILVLAVPYLWEWAFLSSALVPTSYGWWSVMATASAIGVGVFSVRDLFAAQRSDRLLPEPAANLVAELPARQRVLVTGGTGFIGQRLVAALVEGGHFVTVVTRDIRKVDMLTHPVRAVECLEQIHSEERIDFIVNLAGDPIASGLWTKSKRARIIGSRVAMTHAIAALVARLEHKPDCLINGSAIGWYGLHEDTKLTESSLSAPAFVQEVCQAWEDAAQRVSELGVRVVAMRLGLVLGVEGGMLAKLLTPFEFGLGGSMGSGKQWMSWVALDDVVAAIAFVATRADCIGPVNITAPEPVRNARFAKLLAASLNRPAWLKLPAFLLSLGLGQMGRETMLGGQRVLPERLMALGFRFRHPDLETALRKMTGAKSARKVQAPNLRTAHQART